KPRSFAILPTFLLRIRKHIAQNTRNAPETTAVGRSEAAVYAPFGMAERVGFYFRALAISVITKTHLHSRQCLCWLQAFCFRSLALLLFHPLTLKLPKGVSLGIPCAVLSIQAVFPTTSYGRYAETAKVRGLEGRDRPATQPFFGQRLLSQLARGRGSMFHAWVSSRWQCLH